MKDKLTCNEIVEIQLDKLKKLPNGSKSLKGVRRVTIIAVVELEMGLGDGHDSRDLSDAIDHMRELGVCEIVLEEMTSEPLI